MNTENTTKAYCNHCGHETNHSLIATRRWLEEVVEGNDEEHVPPVYEDHNFEFLQCCGCENVALRRTTSCEEQYGPDYKNIVYFPPAVSRREPIWRLQLWRTPNIYRLLKETYVALHSDSRRLAMMGARTLIDMVILDKVGDVGTFPQKLNALKERGFIGEKNREFLHAALDAGSAAVHRGHEHTAKDVNHVMDIVENLLHAVYILPAASENLKKTTPPRPKSPSQLRPGDQPSKQK